MALFPDPPTYADPVLLDEATGRQQFNPIWLKWFLDVAAFVSASGGGGGGGAAHNSLTGLQGGGTGEEYHFTAAEHTALIAGFTGTGKLVRETSPTIATSLAVTGPITGRDATALIKSSTALNNGAGAAAGTLLNAPAAGNPTKWVPINDNGTTRYIPAW